MAEAVVEDRPQPPQKFYCHLCNMEIQSVNADYTCPLCSGGFIEEIQESNNEPAPEDVEMQDVNRIDDLDMIRDELATLLMPLAGGGGGGGGGIGTRMVVTESEGGTEEDSSGGGGSGNLAGGPRRRRSHRRGLRMQNIGRFDNVLLEILQTLSGNNEAALGNASMFFMGNPGDYAWGREGIDTIVTQLLNQMDTSGPPPLPKEKIDEIPNVDITQDQVDIKLQCSVCWEDFQLSESVRRLPCLHVYHENCIVPWLELHGTCPICRKSLTPDGPDIASNTLRNAYAAFRATSADESPGPSSSSSPMLTSNQINNINTNAISINPQTLLSSQNQQQQQQFQQQHQQQQQESDSQQQQEQQQQQNSEFHNIVIPLSLSRMLSQAAPDPLRPYIVSIIDSYGSGDGGGATNGGGNNSDGQYLRMSHQQQQQQQQQEQPSDHQRIDSSLISCDINNVTGAVTNSNISNERRGGRLGGLGGNGGSGSGGGGTGRFRTNNTNDVFNNEENVDFEFD